MTNSTENPLCTCPSGDGSLQHPCPMHPASTNELKLGDVISVFSCHLESKNDWFVIRLCNQNDVDNYTNHIKQNEWQRGIHPSLIPKGFELVESAEFEACKECVGLSKQQNDLLKEQIGLLKQTHRLELEAAQKEIERLRLVLEIESAYCQKHANLLKDTDKPRSLRHRERADRLRDSINPKPKDRSTDVAKPC